MKYTIDQVNSMDYDDFSNVFGNIIEHCSLIAASIWRIRQFRDLKDLHEGFSAFIDTLPPLAHKGILRSHPDLAGRLAQQGLLTSESTNEQKAAELNTLTSDERAFLNKHNDEYKRKFGFPFVICARENKKEAMLDGIRNRINNTAEVELKTGIEEVKKIAFYRLIGIVQE